MTTDASPGMAAHWARFKTSEQLQAMGASHRVILAAFLAGDESIPSETVEMSTLIAATLAEAERLKDERHALVPAEAGPDGWFHRWANQVTGDTFVSASPTN